jgi:hypothetical protein
MTKRLLLTSAALCVGKTVCPFRERGWFALHWCSEGCSGGGSAIADPEARRR